MARFVVQKLPPHWLFLPSRRQVRELLARLEADVRLAEFFGTAYSCTPDRISLGFVESRVVECGWRFYLRLWGIRKAVAGLVQEKLAAAKALDEEWYVKPGLSMV